MTEETSKTVYLKGPSIGGILLILLFSAIGYFTYGGLSGFFGILLLCIILYLLTVLALIPAVGFIINILLMHFVIFPWFYSCSGLSPSMLTSAIFWVFSIFYLLVTGIITLTAVAIQHIRD